MSKLLPDSTESDWLFIEKFGNFKRAERFGNIYKLKRASLYRLQELRESAANPITINAGWAVNGHSENSLHYQGLAIDCYIHNLSLYEQARVAVARRYSGIGVYPWWTRPGLHVDDRLYIGKRSVYWVSPSEGQYDYYSSFSEFLERVADLPPAGVITTTAQPGDVSVWHGNGRIK